jgi:hypothetical protein
MNPITMPFIFGVPSAQYELYPLPFFNAEARSTWVVEFLKSCDGAVGWSSLLQVIVADMIRAGPSGLWPGV